MEERGSRIRNFSAYRTRTISITFLQIDPNLSFHFQKLRTMKIDTRSGTCTVIEINPFIATTDVNDSF
jgi:hypothetical protein